MIKQMRNIRDKGIKCTLLITETCINMEVYISKFSGKYVGGHGDFQYEIKFINAEEIKIFTTKELKVSTPAAEKKPARPEPKKTTKKTSSGNKTTTYTVKAGDTLWRLAQKFLGNGAKYMQIYNLNKDKIKNPDLIKVGWKLRIPSK